ncbi:ABC-2 transporter permease [uncultured Eubacterium sp.]|uniref:ABC-2 transporter permease n=1 Tax=uncultured Eubacterium sp. TaxID=165185 RepID=UPI0025EE3E11|nr:ABC-2 transporter permease [uncultured Eubacterium sp.]
MRGLLEKDIRLLLHSKQTFLCVIAITIILGVTQKNTFVLGYSTFLMAALLVSTLSYDEMDHGLAFLFTLPIDRKIYVREKYLLCIGGSIIAWFIALVLYLVVMVVSNSHIVFSEELVRGVDFLPIGILYLSLLLPLQLKFGVEKSRLVVVGVSVFVGSMIYFLADKSEILDGNVLVSASDLVGDAAVSVIGLSVAGCLAVVSYLCSCRIMKKKEL